MAIDISERFPNIPSGIQDAQSKAGDDWADHVNWWAEEDTADTNEVLALRALIEVAREDTTLISEEDFKRATDTLRTLTADSEVSLGQIATTRELVIVPYSGTEDPVTASIREPNPIWKQMPA